MIAPPPAASAATTERDDPTIWRVDDGSWALVAPVLKSEKERRKPGRPRRDDCAIFDGLIWLARTGAQWSQLPREFGPKSTVHERFTEWTASGGAGAGVGGAAPGVRRRGRVGLGLAGGRRLHRQGAVRPKGDRGEAQATGRNPTDRGKPGTERHLLTEAKGIPTALVITGANRHDMTQLAALLDGVVVEPAPTAPPRLALDRGYDDDDCRAAAAARGDEPHTPPPPPASAERPAPAPGHPDRHPPRRWVVEAAHSWFNRFRRLLTRTEKQARRYLGFVQLAAILIVYRKVRRAELLSG